MGKHGVDRPSALSDLVSSARERSRSIGLTHGVGNTDCFLLVIHAHWRQTHTEESVSMHADVTVHR